MNLAYPIVGAFSNWFFRGGGVESVLLKGKNFEYGKPINALIFAVLCMINTGQDWIFITSLAAMIAGQSPKWGVYIGAIRKDNDKGYWWGVGALTLRGLFWGVCLAILFLFISWKMALLFTLAGSTQGVVYAFCIWLGKFKFWKQTVVFNDWTLGEMIHGFILWAPLSIA